MELLTVESPGRIRLRIHGPMTHKHVGVVGLDRDAPAFLGVSDALAQVTVRDPEGNGLTWRRGTAGPRFFEETQYRVSVENLARDGVPRVVQRYPGALGDFDQFPDQHLLTGVVNFHGNIGRSVISIVAGLASIDVEIEVFPTKLDYASDFPELLQEVGAAARALALEYLSSTFVRGSAEEASSPADLEWLVLLHHHVDSLEGALNYVAAHPHRVLEKVVSYAALARIRRTDATFRRAVVRGLGQGEAVTLPGIGKVRTRMPTQSANETLNTPEHRWLRYRLELVVTRLGEIRAQIDKSLDLAIRSGRHAPSLRAARTELSSLLARLDRLRGLEPLSAATRLQTHAAPSLTLLNGLGYREGYKALTALHLGLNIEDGSVQFSLKEMHELYETWCFLRLLQLLAGVAGARRVAGDVVRVTRSGARVTLKHGQQSKYVFDDGEQQLTLLFNPTYPGLTGDQRPDIVLEFQRTDWPAIIVVFDAKYRLQSDANYVRAFGCAGPPTDAVNALHRYRDAIVVRSASVNGRPTVKGVALFPLPSAEASRFNSSKLRKALDELGVGALPFTPQNSVSVESWLQDLLELSSPQLAIPGPPFLAHDHAERERAAAQLETKRLPWIVGPSSSYHP